MNLRDAELELRARPLQRIRLEGCPLGTLVVSDGRGNAYHRANVEGDAEFVAGGAPGLHTARVLQSPDAVVRFWLDAETSIEDGAGKFRELLTMLTFTMLGDEGENRSVLWNGRIYRYFICWLRDHVHTLKGMKYFDSNLRSAIDLYRDSQRADGMMWDNVNPVTEDASYWQVRFAEGDFCWRPEGSRIEFHRIPAENDVEYLFVEGVYVTWKATGDDGWMASQLEAARRALRYTRESTLRWSAVYDLPKRGYTIDTWDFQSEFHRTVEGDMMRIREGETRFGVMIGDVTGRIVACRQLSEMLETVGDDRVAEELRAEADALQQRLDDLAWAGTHYLHHVPEEPHPFDFGVDEREQVSLSNAYSLNRGIDSEKVRAIVDRYRALSRNLPPGSPGEWYTIYPPFERGFGSESSKWQYMNASVTPIVAGELAHGAFLHGREEYAADVLLRLIDLGRRHGNVFHCSYTGAMPEPEARRFVPIDLTAAANSDIAGPGAEGVLGFPNSPNDFRTLPTGRLEAAGVPFLIADPSTNGRRGAVSVGRSGGFAERAQVSIGAAGKSLYLFHFASGGGPHVGTLRIRYVDGDVQSREILMDRDMTGWWMPDGFRDEPGDRTMTIGWKGANETLPYLAISVVGIPLDRDDVAVEALELVASVEGRIWHLVGATVGEEPVWFPTRPISFGIPDGWGAAAVVYALIEGLAGVVDESTALDVVTLAPRWSSAGETEADVCVTYPASDGYVAYRYRHVPEARRIELDVTGSGSEASVRVLLPTGVTSARVQIDGRPAEGSVETVDQSRYAVVDGLALWPTNLVVQYEEES